MTAPDVRGRFIRLQEVRKTTTKRSRSEKSQGRRVPVPALLALVAASLVGTLDECIQWILPSRVFEWTNILASLMSIVGMVVLG